MKKIIIIRIILLLLIQLIQLTPSLTSASSEPTNIIKNISKQISHFISNITLPFKRAKNLRSPALKTITEQVQLSSIGQFLTFKDLSNLSLVAKSTHDKIDKNRRLTHALTNGRAIYSFLKNPTMAAGVHHTCAIFDREGHVRCWGRNNFGQARVPDNLPLARTISAGANHTCIIRKDNAHVRCWGEDQFVRAVPGEEELGAVLSISSGHTHACAIKKDLRREREHKRVVCWSGDNREFARVPQDLGPASAISAGVNHTCAITDDRDRAVRCWGDAGRNDFDQENVPPDLGPVRAISAGAFHTCALPATTATTANGSVRCWGRNEFHQLEVPPELKLAKADNIISITSGRAHSCAMIEVKHHMASYRCWGWAPSWSGPNQDRAYVGYLQAIVSGSFHICLLTHHDSTIQCFGNDRDHRLDPQ